MNRGLSNLVLVGIVAVAAMIASTSAMAEAKHKMLIQVSTADATTQTIALNNAVNLQKLYGMDDLDIEVVAYGPGLSLLTENSAEGERVTSLAMQNITFSACGNTMQKIEKKTGKTPALVEGVRVVPAGVARILEAQEEGYAYLRP